MKRNMIAILMLLVLAVSLVACGGKETTVTGMVVSVEDTVISLVEMDAGNLGGMSFSEGERPEMPEGMEGFEGFDPGSFDGTMPEGENFPQWGDGAMPEMPEGMEPPEGMTMPQNGEMPDFGGENGGMGPGFSGFGENMEITDVDISNAHISVEIEGGKASGSMSDLVPGTFVTVTVNGKGEATNVLVSSRSGFGGMAGRGNR